MKFENKSDKTIFKIRFELKQKLIRKLIGFEVYMKINDTEELFKSSIRVSSKR